MPPSPSARSTNHSPIRSPAFNITILFIIGSAGRLAGRRGKVERDVSHRRPVGLSIQDARRIALRAQGYGRPRPARVSARHVEAAVRTMGLVQLDYVNVLVPAPYLLVYSRVGPYDRGLFDAVA